MLTEEQKKKKRQTIEELLIANNAIMQSMLKQQSNILLMVIELCTTLVPGAKPPNSFSWAAGKDRGGEIMFNDRMDEARRLFEKLKEQYGR